MLRRNKLVPLAVVVLFLGTFALAQDPQPPQPMQWPTPPPQQQPQDAPNQPGNTVQVPNNQSGQAPSSENNGVYVFRANVQEVQLHATVVDDKHRFVNGLNK